MCPVDVIGEFPARKTDGRLIQPAEAWDAYGNRAPVTV